MSTILIAEDDDLIRDMIERLLTTVGFTVIATADGQACLDQTLAQLPDLILMDIGMPRVNGLEATRRLKEDERTRHIPILALTAYAFPEDRKRALAAGCDDFETKPIDFTSLLQKIRQLIRVSTDSAASQS